MIFKSGSKRSGSDRRRRFRIPHGPRFHLPLIALLLMFGFLAQYVVEYKQAGTDIVPLHGLGLFTGNEHFDFGSSEIPKFSIKAASISAPVIEELTGILRTGKGSISARIIGSDGTVKDGALTITPEKDSRFSIGLGETDHLPPGKYTLSITIEDESGSREFTQEFTWGVFAINLDQSSYRVDETPTVSFSVLDDKGTTQCEADIGFDLIAPNGKSTEITPEANPDCEDKSVTNDPDFFADIPISQEGVYQIHARAKIEDGVRQRVVAFTVGKNADFVTRRYDSAIRIYPANSYEMSVDVTVGKEFNGVISESFPGELGVLAHSASIGGKEVATSVVDGDIRSIATEKISLKKDETLTLKYTYKAPLISPEFYAATITATKKKTVVFTEPNPWEIASDAVGDVTLLWDTANGAIPSGWTCVSCTSGDPFFQVFPRGAANYSATTAGGPESHTHSYTAGTSTGPSATTTYTGALLNSVAVGSAGHTQGFSTVNTAATDLKPPYQNLIMIRANNPISLPINIIAPFDVENTNLPAFWTHYSGLDSRYLRGENTNTTGGSATHTHTRGASTAAAGATSNADTLASSAPAPTGNHSHTVAAGSTPVTNNDPNFVTVNFARLTKDGEALADGMLAFFDNSAMPVGWTNISSSAPYQNNLLKGATGGSGTVTQTGGRTAHDHGGSETFTSSAPSATVNVSALITLTAATATHTHDVTYTISSASSMPVYRDVIIGKVKMINVAGRVYSDEGVTPLASKPLKASVLGIAQRVGTTDASGNYLFNLPDPGPGAQITIWLDNTTETGALQTLSSGSNISGADIYQNRLILRHENAGPIINNDIGVCDKNSGSICSDADLHFNETGGFLTVDNDWALFIWSAKTYSPGGNVTLSSGATAASPGGDLKLQSSTSVLNAALNTLFIGGDLKNGAGGTITLSTGQNMTFNGTNTGFTVDHPAAAAFQNVTFNSVGGAWSFASSSQTIAGNLTISNGSVTAPSSSLTIGSSYSNSGTFTAGSTTTFNATTTGRTLSGTLNGTSSFQNLTFNGVGGAWSIGASTTATDNFTISNGSVTAPSGILTIGDNYSNSGTFTHNSGIVRFNATDTDNTISGTLSGTSRFNDIEFNGVGGAWAINSAIETLQNGGNVTIANGTVTAPGSTFTIGNNYTNNDNFLHNNGTVIFTATNTGKSLSGQLNASDSFYNLSFTGGGTWTLNNNTAADNDMLVSSGTVAGAVDLEVNGGDITGNGVITFTGGTTILRGSGNFGGTSNWQFNNLQFGNTIANSTTALATSTITVLNELKITATQTLLAGSKTYRLRGTTVPFVVSGTFTANTSTVLYQPSAVTTLSVVNVTYHHVTFDGSGSTFNVIAPAATQENGNFTITAGTLNTNSFLLTLGGNYTNSDSFVAGTGLVRFVATDAGNTLSGQMTSSNAFYNLTFDGVGGAWSFGASSATANNNFTITNGAVTAPSSTLRVGNNYTNNDDFLHNNGTLIMTATDAGNTLSGQLTGTDQFNNIEFNGIGGGFSFSGPAQTTAPNGNFTITNGAVTAPSLLTVGGNYTNNDDFIAGTNSVLLNATDTGNTVSGQLTGADALYNLTFNGAGGAWSFGSSAARINNDFLITTGTVTAPSTTLTIANTYTNNGTFTHNSGETIFIATDAGNTINGTMTGSSQFNKVTFNGVGGAWLFTSNAQTAASNGNFTITNGDVTAPASLTVGGDYTNNDNFIAGTGTVTFTATDSGNTINGQITLSDSFYNLTFNGVGGAWSFSGNANVNNNFLITNGNVTAPALLTIGNNYTNNDNFIAGTGLVRMFATDAGNTLNGQMTAADAFYDLQFNGIGGAWSFSGSAATTNNNFDITNGTVTAPSSILRVGNNYTNNDNFVHNGGEVIMTGTDAGNTVNGQLTGSDQFNNLTFNGVGGGFSFSGNAQTANSNGSFTITNGTVTAPSLLTIGGNYTNNDNFIAGTGLVLFTATDSGNTLNGQMTSADSFYDITFNGSGGAWSFGSSNAAVSNDFLITAGTVTAPSSTLTITNTYTNNGIFTHNSGTVTFNATDVGNTINGTMTGTSQFNKMIFNGVGGKWLFTSNAQTAANSGDFTITNGEVTAPAILTLGNNYDNNDRFIHSNGLVNFSATGAGRTIESGVNSPWFNVTFTGSGGWTFAVDNANIQNNWLTNAGTVASTVDIEANGDVSCSGTCGTITITSGTVSQRVASNKIFATTTGSNIWTFNNLRFSNSSGSARVITTQTGGTGAVVINGNLLVSITADTAGTTLSAGNRDWQLVNPNGADPFNLDQAGGVLSPVTSTFSYLGDSDIGNVNVQSTIYYNLQFGGAVTETYVAEGAITAQNDVTVNAQATLQNSFATTVNGSMTGAGTVTLTGSYLQRVAANKSFGSTGGSNTWTFAAANFENSSAGDQIITVSAGGTGIFVFNNNLTVGKAGDANQTHLTNGNNRVFDAQESIAITTKGRLTAAATANFTVAGSWNNLGVFTANGGTVTFDSTDFGETINSGGLGANNDFAKVTYNNASGGWTIVNNDLRATGNYTLTAIGSHAASSGRLIETNGTYSACNTCFGNTVWTNVTLFLNSGSSYTVGSKTQTAETYGTLQIGANTDIRMWLSDQAAITVNVSGSLYSQDYATVDGALRVYGDYHTIGSDYWRYDTDFDGVALAGTPRQVVAQIEGGAGRGVTIDGGGQLQIVGGSTGTNQFTDVKSLTGSFQLINSGTTEVHEAKIDQATFAGGTWAPYNTVITNHIVTAGTLTLDWYLGTKLVDRDATSTNINTVGADLTYSEIGGNATIFQHNGTVWGSPTVSRTADTNASGELPQPNSSGALRIREYTQTAGSSTYYRYNAVITDQPSFTDYNYFRDHGNNYLTSDKSGVANTDKSIGNGWFREIIATQNTPTSVNEPSTNGTWYLGMAKAILLFWDNPSFPTGWDCVSCSGGDPYYQRFIRATSTYGGVGGGPEDGAHDFTFTSATAGVAEDKLVLTSSVASGAHTHDWTPPAGKETTFTDIKPPYQNLYVIRGPATGAWPNGVIAPFDLALGSLPSGWSDYTPTIGTRYARGENGTTQGGTATHDHTNNGILSGAAVGSVTVSTLTTLGSTPIANAGHTHALTSGTALGVANNTPLFFGTSFFKLTGGPAVPPADALGMFDHTESPPGWSLVSNAAPYNNNLLKASTTVATACIPGTNCSATHDHGGTFTKLALVTGTITEIANGVGANAASGAHRHNVTYSISSETSMPLYRDTVFMKYSALANVAPNAPTSLTQKRTDTLATISTGGWVNTTGITFGGTLSDPDAADSLQLCIEAKPIGTAFDGTESCNSTTLYTGSPITVAHAQTMTDATQYHWRARTKDLVGLTSAWVSYGGNSDGSPADRDFGIDTTAPTVGSVYDNTNIVVQPSTTDSTYNGDGSLTTLSASWDGFNLDVSGLNLYEYAIGTTVGGTETKAWTGVGSSTSFRDSSLALQTGQIYYISVRVTDNAGNISPVATSNGIEVTPQISFDIDIGGVSDPGDTSGPYEVTFSSLDPGNVTLADQYAWFDLSTNAKNGGRLFLRGTNGGLFSPTASFTITSATADLSAVQSGFGAQVVSTTQTSGGPLVASSPYNSGGDAVGIVSSQITQILQSSSVITGGRASVQFKAKTTAVTPAARDYEEIISLTASSAY